MKLGLNLRLSQSIKLTPLLQQSIKLLQASQSELNDLIEEYLSDNIFLKVKDTTLLSNQSSKSKYSSDQTYYDILNNEHRMNHKFCEYIHEKLFNRDLTAIRLKIIEDKQNKTNVPNLNQLAQKIDVYSLGTFPLMILIESCYMNALDFKLIIDLLKSEEFNPIMTLLYDMTEQDYRNRISANEAYSRYSRYLNLINILQ